jgi:hypothetical protein
MGLWPARSPDLNTLDPYLCYLLKIIVSATVINEVAEQKQRVEEVCELIRNAHVIF